MVIAIAIIIFIIVMDCCSGPGSPTSSLPS
jgi:hypothetical protein